MSYNYTQMWSSHEDSGDETSSYKSKIGALKFEEPRECNTLTIQENGKKFSIRCDRRDDVDDIFVIQHYKAGNISGVNVQDRWKHAECSIRVGLSKNEDEVLTTTIVDTVQKVVNKFITDPGRKCNKI